MDTRSIIDDGAANSLAYSVREKFKLLPLEELIETPKRELIARLLQAAAAQQDEQPPRAVLERAELVSFQSLQAWVWSNMVAVEPELARLEADIIRLAQKTRTDPQFSANDHWYGRDGAGFKDVLVRLVGYAAGVREPLRTSQAYDFAYQRLYNLLPDDRYSEETDESLIEDDSLSES
jgi:hypothetical protein